MWPRFDLKNKNRIVLFTLSDNHQMWVAELSKRKVRFGPPFLQPTAACRFPLPRMKHEPESVGTPVLRI